jgi:hypothetical protein
VYLEEQAEWCQREFPRQRVVNESGNVDRIIEFLKVAVSSDTDLGFMTVKFIIQAASQGRLQCGASADGIVPECMLVVLPVVHLDPQDVHNDRVEGGSDRDWSVTAFGLGDQLHRIRAPLSWDNEIA